MGQLQLRLKQDVATRWNSTYYIMKLITEVKEPLISTLALMNPQLPSLSMEEWEIIKEACDVLRPFEEVTVELSSERFVTGSKAILMARGLQRATAYRQRNLSTYQPVRELINTLMAELSKRFVGIEQVNVLAEAALLDPKFKKQAFVHENHADDAQTRVVGLVVAVSRGARPPPPATPSSACTEEGEDDPPSNTPKGTVPLVGADFEERVTSLRPGIPNPIIGATLEV
ncbi:hypothetical protein Pmani_021276 [Petrolisthes manimaculis]|uniref:Uncharacterized protein n=1 Tax=Petrolisthes manimaculis TaxID=1843537 RepID=A0AAE1PGY9_9EUCA|nr:hypothetical protein Pmani_021276 [Petrolisthes manimaculis]